MMKSTNNRYGWYLQQLLKLYVSRIITTISPYYLTVDCDTIFLKPTKFFTDDDKPICTLGTEYTKPYFEWMEKLDSRLQKSHPNSGITHHMMYSVDIVNEMISRIETNHPGSSFWETYINLVNPAQYDLSGAAENELYFTYIVVFHPKTFATRFLKWQGVRRLDTNNQGNYDFVSWHWYLRL